MKIRNSFVSNSSSCSFCITNYTKSQLTVRDFILENPQLIDEYNEWYGGDYTLETVLDDAECNEEIVPGKNYMEFGDDLGGPVNNIFDYILREGGQSERFSWRLIEMLR